MDAELIGKIVVAIISVVGAIIGLIAAILKQKEKHTPESGKTGTNLVESATGQTVQIGKVEGDMIMSTSDTGTTQRDKSSETEDKKTTIENQTHIKLASVYTSVFAEDGQLQTEVIHLEQLNGTDIKGKVELVAKEKGGRITSKITYSFRGTFDNRVLTGEYFSESQSDDERGAINLKLISKEILSGFCSFSKVSATAEDEIRMSPYVWVAGENLDLINGSYSFCAECYREKADCCCASDEVDMPVLLHDEASIIQSTVTNRSKRKMAHFSTLIDHTPVRQIKREKCDGGGGSHCHFYNCTEKMCRIYEKRPVDCRLFPFDIVLNKATGEYEVGYYPALCNRELPDYTQMKQIAHILRPYFFLLYPYAHIITTDTVCERLKDAEFTKIALLRDFVF